jgi:hypothetical protein
MKFIVYMFNFFVTTPGSQEKLPDFLSTSEKQFVKNVIELVDDKPTEITKSSLGFIILEFPEAKYQLKPNGYIGEMWLKEDDTWISLGTEENAY